MGLVAPQHGETSQTRHRTCVPCTGRQILNHWTAREVPFPSFLPKLSTQGQSFSASELLTLEDESFFVVGPVLSVLGCLAAPMASPSEMPGEPFPQKAHFRNQELFRHCQPSSRGKNHPMAENHATRGCMIGGHSGCLN